LRWKPQPRLLVMTWVVILVLRPSRSFHVSNLPVSWLASRRSGDRDRNVRGLFSGTLCSPSLNARILPHQMIEANLGETLRRLRATARLSLRSLAQKTGFSASFLSQVENGQVSPSLASMERIAVALGVTMGQIFEGAEREKTGTAVTRPEARITLHSQWSKARIEALSTPASASRLEPVLLVLEPGGSSGTRPYSSSREEFAFVIQGTVILSLQENEMKEASQHQLRSGDAVTIRSGIGRMWQNLGDLPVHILMVSAR
jgi:XRE family transcriptional regulator, regulator of sulfur utilization